MTSTGLADASGPATDTAHTRTPSGGGELHQQRVIFSRLGRAKKGPGKKESMKGSKSANASLFEAASGGKRGGGGALHATSSSSIPRGLNTMTPSESDEEDLESTPVVSNAPSGGGGGGGGGGSGQGSAPPTAPFMGTARKASANSARKRDGKNVLTTKN